jgi:flagellar motility protein MotE (MotC chaperone)
MNMASILASGRPAKGAASFLALAGCLLFLSGQSGATQSEPPAALATASEIEKFCGNIADAARDRRYAIQTQELEALKAEIDTRVKQLEEKRAEYERWMKLRQEFMDQASENVVSIYARMRADAAAERLAEMQPELAAAIMMKLQVKQSGLIMNEMERSTAAKLTGIMASAARKDDPT